MIVMLIVSILASLAAPSMSRLIRDNRLRSMGADFSAMLKYARSESKSKGQPVLVGTIDDANAWGDNIVIAFIDTNADGNYDAADQELRRLDISDNFVITAQDSVPSNVSTVTFLSSGFTNAGALQFTLCDTDAETDGFQYDVLASGLSYRSDFVCP